MLLISCCFVQSVVLRSNRSGTRSGDGQHKPTSNCATKVYDDVDDIVFEVLPSPRPQDTCSFETLVTLDTNLVCQGRECGVSTVRVVEVVPGASSDVTNVQAQRLHMPSTNIDFFFYSFSFYSGVFYEYLRLPCVHLPFYQDAVKVFSG